MKKLIFILPVLALLSCGRNQVKVNGLINETEKEKIYLDRMGADETVLADSSKINKKGEFNLKAKAGEPNYYRLRLSDKNFITLLTKPGKKITVTSDKEFLPGNYTVRGSENSSKIRTIDNKLLETQKKLDSLTSLFKESIDKPGSDTIREDLNNKYQEFVDNQRNFNISFILDNINSLASIKALYQKFDEDTYVLFKNRDLQYLKIVADSLKKSYPDSKHTKALIADLNQGLDRYNKLRINQMAENMPKTALNVQLPDINGDTISMLSNKGKYVLLSFWSAGSEDCIEENLEFKTLYKRYHKLGFEIYQVSIDSDVENWKKAVKFDELPWISVIEQYPENSYTLGLFNVKTVPVNYLFDKEGNLIGKDLHGRALRIKMNQLFD